MGKRPQGGKGQSKPNPNKQSRPQKPYSGKNYGKGGKQDRREEEIADTGYAMSRSNPYSFYNKFSQFAEDAGRISFARPLGAVYDIKIHNVSSVRAAAPGVMRIAFAPSIGVSNDFDSPINRSSINYYARIRSTQKAFGDYDHQDLTMMMLAIDSAIMYHALGRRIYGLLTDMTPLNKYYPRALVAACGVSFPNTQKNIQDFRAFLNEFALQIEQYALPKNIELFNRHSWMCEGLYVDSESTRAQTYMFVPTGFWQYDNTVSSGSQLVWKQYLGRTVATPAQYTVEQFMDFGRELITAMSNDADFATMSGDLYAYYGGDILRLPYIDEKYAILPKYDKTVLSQIENATIAGVWPSGKDPVISQNPSVNNGAILFQPTVISSITPIVENVRMNFHWDSPSSQDVMEASRLITTLGDETSAGSGEFKVKSCGSEIVQWLDVYNTNPDTNGIRFFRIQQMTQYFQNTETGSKVAELLGNILYLANFDWSPRIEVLRYHNDATPDYWTYSGSTWDLDNFTDIGDEYMEYLNTAALYSLFNIESR